MADQTSSTSPTQTAPMTRAESLAAAKAEALGAARTPAEASGTPPPTPGQPAEGQAAAEEGGGTGAGADSGAGQEQPKKEGQGGGATEEGGAGGEEGGADAQVMRRSAAIAQRERQLREAKKEQQETLQAGELLGRARAAFKEGNDLQALEVLGIDVDEHYQRLTSAILARDPKKELSTEELVERKVEEKLKAKGDEEKKANGERLKAEEARLRGVYLDRTYALLGSAEDKYPDVVRAIGTRKLTEQDICETAEAYFEAEKKPPTPEVVLGLIQEQLSSKKKPAAPSKPAAAPIVPANGSWTSHAPPQPERPMTREESLREAKRQAGLPV